jgi:sugar lactone lactonase YvrE
MDINFTRGLGKLFRFDENRNRTTILNNLSLPNGMGWSSDNETFYFIDSLDYVVWAFDYNLQRGEISNQREFYRFLPANGIPDGMCVDTKGNLLIAMWGGGAIVVLSPEGKFIRNIGLPVSKPTSCILTGIKGLELIVTTSSQGIDLSTEPLGGRLLSVTELNL